jgi:hypothetical protein
MIPVGSFPAGAAELQRRLGVRPAPLLAWKAGPPLDLWRDTCPDAQRVVVCPARPRGQLLQAACLAGAARAPLWVTMGSAADPLLGRQLVRWGTRKVYLVGAVPDALPAEVTRAGARPVRLADELALTAACVRWLARGHGPIETAVVCNPADTAGGLGGMSALAPWLAVQKRAALLLTNAAGGDVEAVVERAVAEPALRRLNALILAAGLRAIPMPRRPNPLPSDKDPTIEMEPLTPRGAAPFSFAVGRLFHRNRAVVPLLLARQRLLTQTETPRALVASNPGGGLSLLEAFSRSTARELRRAGYRTTTLFGNEVRPEMLRRLLPGHDVFLWEGHHNTLIQDWNFPSWNEPLPPALVFLQSCLALQEHKVEGLLRRGAVGVLGTSTRTYSGSGGACSLAFFAALLHEERSTGEALRQAKNFLLASALLKEKRLGKAASRAAASRRAAWAFTLWGDPTLRLPLPTPPSLGEKVRHEVVGNTIVLRVPLPPDEEVTSGHYRVRLPAGARLAGLVRRSNSSSERHLVPLVFAEVHLPRARTHGEPRLHSRLPATRWVFLWDARRGCGYLLAAPRARRTLRFHVEWPTAEVASDRGVVR